MIRVGTDCSGMEAPIMALQMLKIPFSHEFSSEIDKHCRSTIQANYKPKILYEDMKNRDVKSLPDIDLYVCGFPCQPFSVAGKREGTLDPRGTIFWECLKVIKAKKPEVFLLENVKGLLSIQNGETFKEMIRELEKIRGYKVVWKVLNTADYGIPQNRKRVFIIGRRGRKIRFQWPTPMECKPIEDFVEWNETHKDKLYPSRKEIYQNKKNTVFVNLGFYKGTRNLSQKLCPTLNSSKLWCMPLGRFATRSEYLSLQGFPKDFKVVVSEHQFCKQIGNSISVNVLVEILKNIYLI